MDDSAEFRDSLWHYLRSSPRRLYRQKVDRVVRRAQTVTLCRPVELRNSLLIHARRSLGNQHSGCRAIEPWPHRCMGAIHGRY